jgi:hypothetical protein
MNGMDITPDKYTGYHGPRKYVTPDSIRGPFMLGISNLTPTYMWYQRL